MRTSRNVLFFFPVPIIIEKNHYTMTSRSRRSLGRGFSTTYINRPVRTLLGYFFSPLAVLLNECVSIISLYFGTQPGLYISNDGSRVCWLILVASAFNFRRPYDAATATATGLVFPVLVLTDGRIVVTPHFWLTLLDALDQLLTQNRVAKDVPILDHPVHQVNRIGLVRIY